MGNGTAKVGAFSPHTHATIWQVGGSQCTREAAIDMFSWWLFVDGHKGSSHRGVDIANY